MVCFVITHKGDLKGDLEMVRGYRLHQIEFRDNLIVKEIVS